MMKKNLSRYLEGSIRKDLERKMVFVGGPRQVGKSTLGKSLLTSRSGHLNWDVPDHREIILSRELPNTSPLLFDEIHKYRSWRNYLKGLYDAGDNRRHVLVTGNARLDFYRFGGDSLHGRYSVCPPWADPN